MNNINVLKRNGKKVPLDIIKIRQTLEKAGEGIEGIDILEVERDSHLVFTEGITTNEIQTTLKKTVNDKIRVESPNYTYLGARLELQSLIKDAGRRNKYKPLKEVVEKAVEEGIYVNDLLEYDLNLLDTFIDTSRDNLYTYNGIITFKDRYAKYNKQGVLIEMPQHFFMRIAMAVSIKDFDKDWLPESLIQEVVKKNPLLSLENVYRHCWAIEMYNAYSKFELSGSTPILANAGTPYGMLIACFVGTVGDTLKSRVRSDANFAECSSYGGGVGDDITDLRCNGSSLRNFVSGANGVVPFIKTAHGYTMQYNQAGTRNGSRAISIVPYHWDLFDFIELKKQSGDEARRVKGKGIYPELFIPDLFFKRILAGEEWTLFDPKDVAILNTVWGEEFERLYIEFEQNKHIKKKSYDAYDVFKKIIQSLDGTGAPFIIFRDNFNRRNPQAHDGIIKSSQLCTEIGVVAKPTTFIGWELDADGNAIEKWNLGKTNICCLASVNLARVNEENVERVTRLGVRMLDNVITINKYVTPETYKAGMEDRNIGLGVMGEMEALAQRGIYFGTLEHSNYIDDVYQAMDYYSTQTSSDLAISRGKYKTYEGSSWSQGILTAELGTGVTLEDTDRFKWSELKAKVKKDGMRNANLTAIAPTGTISVHLGTTPCIEPVYKRRYMEEAKNGDMIAVTAPSISINNYQQYQPAEEINQELVLRMAAKRQKWLTQAQSLNLFKPLDGDFDDMMGLYILAWQLGLKSTYYLKNRSKLSASFEDKKESNIACAGCD